MNSSTTKMNFIELDDSSFMKSSENVSPAGSVVSFDENLTDASGDCKEPSAAGEYTGCFEGRLFIHCHGERQ